MASYPNSLKGKRSRTHSGIDCSQNRRAYKSPVKGGLFELHQDGGNQNSRNLTLFSSLGIYAFGLFATDIFVNAGQVVTGNLAPHFLALCKPNYTALGCKQYTQFISGAHACTGNPDLIMKARKTFPSKEAALSVYAAMYLAVSTYYYLISL